jgi:hypothetical protein
VSHLQCFAAYLEAYEAASIWDLPPGKERTPEDAQVSVGALHINGVAFCNSMTSKMPLYNDNSDGNWTAAHLALFHCFADYLTDSDQFNKPTLC